MQTIDKELKTSKKITEMEFGVKQAIVGLSLENNDKALLKYFNFIADILPINEVAFAHIVPKFDLLYALFDQEHPVISGQHELNERLMNQFQSEIEQYIVDKPDLKISYQVEEGSPLDELLLLADDVYADLMVVGQKSSNQKHGILAKNVARGIKFNALVVPEQSVHSIKHILVPIDFSPYSIKALQTAINIKNQISDPVLITCIHVYELPGLAPYNFGKTEEAFRKIIHADRDAALHLFLSNYAPQEQNTIQKVLGVATIKGIAMDIYNYAQKNDVDFMVIGSKGHSMIARMMMGSVTEKLLSVNKTIPTMIIRK